MCPFPGDLRTASRELSWLSAPDFSRHMRPPLGSPPPQIFPILQAHLAPPHPGMLSSAPQPKGHPVGPQTHLFFTYSLKPSLIQTPSKPVVLSTACPDQPLSWPGIPVCGYHCPLFGGLLQARGWTNPPLSLPFTSVCSSSRGPGTPEAHCTHDRQAQTSQALRPAFRSPDLGAGLRSEGPAQGLLQPLPQ